MQPRTPLFRVLILNLWLLLLTTSSSAQSDPALTLTAESLQNGKSVELSKLNWKYLPGDSAGDRCQRRLASFVGRPGV